MVRLAVREAAPKPRAAKRLLWWLRLRVGAVIAGLGIATIVEAVAFVSVLLPYHLRAIDEAEQRGYNRARAEAADPYSSAVIELARERLK